MVSLATNRDLSQAQKSCFPNLLYSKLFSQCVVDGEAVSLKFTQIKHRNMHRKCYFELQTNTRKVVKTRTPNMIQSLAAYNEMVDSPVILIFAMRYNPFFIKICVLTKYCATSNQKICYSACAIESLLLVWITCHCHSVLFEL